MNVKRVRPEAKIPTYGSAEAAGMDLYACVDGDCIVIHPGETEKIPLGIAVAIPQGYVGLIFARSGLGIKQGLAPANKVGVIDSDYRGEIIAALHNHSSFDRVVKTGDRVAQMVIVPYARLIPVEGELDETERGTGGFGSTGR